MAYTPNSNTIVIQIAIVIMKNCPAKPCDGQFFAKGLNTFAVLVFIPNGPLPDLLMPKDRLFCSMDSIAHVFRRPLFTAIFERVVPLPIIRPDICHKMQNLTPSLV